MAVLTDFYINAKQPSLVLGDPTDNLQRQYGNPKSVANVCQYEDPSFVKPLNKLVELERGPKEHLEQLHKVEDLLK